MAAAWFLPAPSAPESGDRLAVRMVQPNIPLDQQWNTAESVRLVDELVGLSAFGSLRPADAPPRLIVWPETPAPFELNRDPEFRRRAEDIAVRSDAHFLVGYLDRIGDAPSNSAALLDPSGRIVSRYDKMHLVPFGEYVPMQNLLFFAGKMLDQVGDYAPGRDLTVSPIGSGRLATVICYESIFPDLVRRFTQGGAELLVLITNDGWFGESAAPFQHLRMGVVRAVENRRYLVRVANSGITAIVDPYGRIVTRAPRAVRTALEGVVHFRSDLTFYARYGDVFAWLNVAIALVGAGLAGRLKPKPW
jgi:apolipoprotein N-acyltransferase